MRSDRLRLQDIVDAIEEIARYLPPDKSKFDSDPPLQSHIYRHLMIIGEAAWRLSNPLKDASAHIPWKQIEGMRHVMVHDYFKIDWNIVYVTARERVPELKRLIEEVIAALP